MNKHYRLSRQLVIVLGVRFIYAKQGLRGEWVYGIMVYVQHSFVVAPSLKILLELKGIMKRTAMYNR
jgi:hypothetical protein